MRRTWLTGALVALGVLAVGCNTQQSNGSGLSGAIEIDGSSTVFPITEAIAEEFGNEHSGVRVRVGQSGTGGGFEKFCNGTTDISDASRPIDDDEKEACAAKGIEFVELKVAIDGVSVVVPEGNDFVDCLTTEELRKIWEPESEVTTWSDVREGLPDEEIKLYGPGADSGTFDYFTDEINGEEGLSRTDFQQSEDDNVLVRGVAGDEYALGYFGYAYYAPNTDKLKALAVDGGDGCVEPTDESIESGDYAPLSRPLFIYVSAEALEREAVQEFTAYYLDNVNLVLEDVGYIPLPSDELEAAKQALEEAAA